jgi:hypothetical protein
MPSTNTTVMEGQKLNLSEFKSIGEAMPFIGKATPYRQRSPERFEPRKNPEIAESAAPSNKTSLKRWRMRLKDS